jgi:hypothetical protein
LSSQGTASASAHGLDANDHWLPVDVTVPAKQRSVDEQRTIQLLGSIRPVNVPEHVKHRLARCTASSSSGHPE